jgi:DNA repair protein RecN (Recombination protein N)
VLLELSIQRIALIESLHLDLRRGLTVFTGETGAGKSILLDSIGLLLGNRASAEWIRKGADDAVVEALFEVGAGVADEVERMFAEWGFDPPAGEPILLTRSLHRSGRSVCRINGRLATLQMLRQLGEKLVQQHGQHEHQGLLKADEQLRLLDLYGGHQEQVASVREAYRAWRAAEQAWKEAHVDEQERARRLDVLNFQIEEIEQAGIRPGEKEELRARRGRLLNLDKIYRAVQQSLECLSGEERSGAVAELGEARQQVAAVAEYAEELQEVSQLLETAEVHAEEAARALARFSGQLDADPAELEAVESRLAQLRALQRKYGATEADILAYYNDIVAERERLSRHEERLTDLAKARDACWERLKAASAVLHERRKAAGERLAEEIQSVLRHLNMERAQFAIDVQVRRSAMGEVAYGEQGMDQVVFLFSANKGEDLKPLSKVASGGELSRTMLAVKAVLAEVDGLETLIFDEIDAGVSGSAAHKLAAELRRLGRGRQVLCVTHSPQIAAAADDHFRIEKVERADDTVTQVARLDRSGRVAEIARLVGSDVADETALTHAEALMEGFHEIPAVNP